MVELELLLNNEKLYNEENINSFFLLPLLSHFRSRQILVEENSATISLILSFMNSDLYFLVVLPWLDTLTVREAGRSFPERSHDTP